MSEGFQRRRLTYRWVAIVVVLGGTVVATAGQQIRNPAHSDIEVFIHAARLLLSGQDLYAVPDPFGHFYLYPPFFAFLNIPLIFPPFFVSVILWTLASVGLFAWSIAAFRGGMTDQKFFTLPAKTRWMTVFLTVLLTARFIVYHLRFGQSNVFVLALAVLAMTFLYRGRIAGAGVLFALSIMIKMTTLPFVFWFLVTRKFRLLAGMAIGVLIAGLLPAGAVGASRSIGYHWEWTRTVLSEHRPGSGNDVGIGNLSMRAQINRFFSDGNLNANKDNAYRVRIVSLPHSVVLSMELAVMAAIGVLIAWYALRYRDAPRLVSFWGTAALTFSLAPNFSPLTEIHHLVLLIPSYVYVIHLWSSGLVNDRVFRVCTVLSFILLTLTSNTFCGRLVSDVLASLGAVEWGMLLLSAAIVRAASRMSKDSSMRDTAVAGAAL